MTRGKILTVEALVLKGGSDAWSLVGSVTRLPETGGETRGPDLAAGCLQRILCKADRSNEIIGV